ncbi:MAG: LacI family DNA-binding transcriptional regulator [Firmicutes bacterium]|nr:LacI family DNA-binding transcriptional regulator [Bacillota bacterium]
MATIKDVAREAGVSIATVSHVLNNTTLVSEKTAQKVLAAIKKVNYHPNSVARSLVTKVTMTLGIIISNITNPFYPEVVHSISRAAAKNGYDIILTSTNNDEEGIAQSVRTLCKRKVDGVIILASKFDDNLISQLTEQGMEVVVYDRNIPTLPVDSVEIDYEFGISQAIQYLKDLGHTRIGYIGGAPDWLTAQKRLIAFQNAMSRYGLKIDERLIVAKDWTLRGGFQAMNTMLRIKSRPTAIVACNDIVAVGALKSIRRKGLKCPEDISVVGIDDIVLASLITPALTTIALPRNQIGEVATKMVIKRLRHKGPHSQKPYTVIFRPNLVIRDSTGPPFFK